MNPLIKLLAIMVSVFLVGFFLEETINSSGLNNPHSLEETFEIISELFSVFVALSIFTITWYAYNKSRDNHSLFLGTTFLITGLLILFHLLSYPFMPDFINPNSSHKAAIFFLESRLILAFLLLASVYVHKDSLPKLINKYVLVLFTIAIMSVSLVSIFFHENVLFMAFDLNSYSTATVFLLLVISIIILVAGYLYTKRAKEIGQNNLLFLTSGSIIVLFSNLVYFSFELSGHFLIITGFFYFYLAMYRSSVELPYEKLAIAEEKVRKGVENKYGTLFDNANDAIITTDLEYLVASWNHSAEKLFGWEAHEVMGKKLSNLIVPLNLQTQGEGIIRDTIDGKSAFGIETVQIHKDGSMIFVSLTTSQLLDSNNNLVGISFIIRDITERKRAEKTIEESLKRLGEEKAKTESIIAAIGDPMSIQDTDFKVLYQNKILHDIIGDQKGKYCYREYEHRDQICEGCPVDMSFKDGKIHTLERWIIKDEQKLYFEITASPLRDSTGNIIAGIEIARDITERKRAEVKIKAALGEKEVLLREIHHRVKNNMQIISSLLMLQSQNIEEKKYKDMFIESQTRIYSMALIHEKLYQSESLAQINFKEYIDGLVSNIFESYNIKSNIKIDINIENIPIKIDYAVPIGLIINELVTNSLKYAFPDGRQGKIQISLKSNDNNMFQLSISDDGIGIPKDLDIRNTKSLGLHLVTALAEGQLHGKVILNRERGTEFHISFGGAK